jgi:hypothetical protein
MIRAIYYAFLQFSSFAQPQSKCLLLFFLKSSAGRKKRIIGRGTVLNVKRRSRGRAQWSPILTKWGKIQLNYVPTGIRLLHMREQFFLNQTQGQ